MRVRFLRRLGELIFLAQSRLAEAQARYKAGFDRTVRENNKDIPEGAFVFLRREVHEVDVNPKLDEQVDGPYRVVQTDGRTFLLRIGDEHVRVSSDRVTPAPKPPDGAPSGRVEPHDEGAKDEATGQQTSQDKRGEANANPSTETPYEGDGQPEAEEHVFERIVGLREAPDGTFRYRVRWYGYSREDDT